MDMEQEMRWVLEEKYGVSAHTDLRSPYSEAFAEDKRRLARGEPAAYVIGWQPFLGLKIFLDSRPLIPRPETEWWTEMLITKAKNDCEERARTERFSAVGLGLAARSVAENRSVRARPLRFLDLCAGSGAIGCAALARLPHAQVSFGEINPAHKTTIQKNIRENGLDESRALVCSGDLFAPFQNERFDVIAANPPYIPDARELPKSVRAYEPAEALRAGADGLALIRRIYADASAHVNKGGQLWLECDDAHAEETLVLAASVAKHSTLRTDPYGRTRLVVSYF